MAEAQVDCNDDDGSNIGGSRITREDVQPGRYYVQVGGYDPLDGSGPDIGTFTIEVRYTEDFDRDGDGSTRPSDCNDDDPFVRPGASEVNNGIDDNCDNITDPDRDGDGYQRSPYGKDCNDTPGSGETTNPGATDVAGNKVDENCDGKNRKFPTIKANVDYNYAGILGPASGSHPP